MTATSALWLRPRPAVAICTAVAAALGRSELSMRHATISRSSKSAWVRPQVFPNARPQRARWWLILPWPSSVTAERCWPWLLSADRRPWPLQGLPVVKVQPGWHRCASQRAATAAVLLRLCCLGCGGGQVVGRRRWLRLVLAGGGLFGLGCLGVAGLLEQVFSPARNCERRARRVPASTRCRLADGVESDTSSADRHVHREARNARRGFRRPQRTCVLAALSPLAGPGRKASTVAGAPGTTRRRPASHMVGGG